MNILTVFLIFLSSALVGISAEGSGDLGDFEPCEACVNQVYLGLWEEGRTAVCARVQPLSACFETCTPQYTPVTDPYGVKFLGMLAHLTALLNQFREFDCELNDEVALGCSSGILDCLQNTVPLEGQWPGVADNLDCGDAGLLAMQTCLDSNADCAWTAHIEKIARRARLGFCSADNQCLSTGTLIVVGSQCRTFRAADLNNIGALAQAFDQPVAGGTFFDPVTCSLQHLGSKRCPLD